MLKKSYFVDYYLNQKIFNICLYHFENYVFCVNYNEYKKYIRYRIVKINNYKYKKTKKLFNGIETKDVPEFNSLFDVLTYFKEQHKIIEIECSKKCEQGYVMSLSKDFFILQLITPTCEKNGIMLCPIDYIESILWDGAEERRLEKLVSYLPIDLKIEEAIACVSEGEQLCEIYHSGFQTFILGKCLKLTESFYLIQSMNVSGVMEGFMLLHSGLVDYISLQTKYIETYHNPQGKINITSLDEFFDYIIHSKIKIEITTEKKKEYKGFSLISYDDISITIIKDNNRKKMPIEKIDILDACIN